MQQWTQVKGSQISVEYQEKTSELLEWNLLPRELVSAPTLEAIKKNLDNHLADML